RRTLTGRPCACAPRSTPSPPRPRVGYRVSNSLDAIATPLAAARGSRRGPQRQATRNRMSDVVAGVRQFIEAKSAGRHGETKVADDDSLFASGIIDSMGIFELATFLEDRFGVQVLDEEFLKRNLHVIRFIA